MRDFIPTPEQAANWSQLGDGEKRAIQILRELFRFEVKSRRRRLHLFGIFPIGKPHFLHTVIDDQGKEFLADLERRHLVLLAIGFSGAREAMKRQAREFFRTGIPPNQQPDSTKN